MGKDNEYQPLFEDVEGIFESEELIVFDSKDVDSDDGTS